jgi:hypothetical protein
MRTQSDVISAAIESLDVQIPWDSARVVGIASSDLSRLEPLFSALGEFGGLPEALRAFTAEIFTYGNLAVFVHERGVRTWPANWSGDQDRVNVANEGVVIEARRPPVGPNGHGTPVLEAGREAFERYWRQQAEHMRALEHYAANPVGSPPGGAKADLAAMNDVLQAIGFEPWRRDDLPRYAHGSALRAEMKQLFESQILQPFAAAAGIAGTPSVVL